MKIIVTGATGFIGSALCDDLAKEHEVIAFTRRADVASTILDTRVKIVAWETASLTGWEKYIEKADAIVNLAGANIAQGRWNEKKQGEISNSRIDGYKILLEAISNAAVRPSMVILSSATGYYGDRGDVKLEEDSEKGIGFLSDLCSSIESFAEEFEKLGLRCIVIRMGVVLGWTGGALPMMAMPFRFYAGGHWGSGEQWMSWINLVDEIAAIKFLIEHTELKGTYNLCSPQPIKNRDFFKIMGRQMKRPSLMTMPAAVLKLIFGEMANDVFLSSQRAYPKRLIDAGYEFQYADLKHTLARQ